MFNLKVFVRTSSFASSHEKCSVGHWVWAGVDALIGRGISQGDGIVEVGVVVLSPISQGAKMSPKPMKKWVLEPRVETLGYKICRPYGTGRWLSGFEVFEGLRHQPSRTSGT